MNHFEIIKFYIHVRPRMPVPSSVRIGMVINVIRLHTSASENEDRSK
jgi:hypothetical protein